MKMLPSLTFMNHFTFLHFFLSPTRCHITWTGILLDPRSSRPKLDLNIPFDRMALMRLPLCRPCFLGFAMIIAALADEQCSFLQSNSVQNKTKGVKVKDRLQRGEKLPQNERLVSENGRIALVLQSDGNLVQQRLQKDGSFWGAPCFAQFGSMSPCDGWEDPPGPQKGPYYLTIDATVHEWDLPGDPGTLKLVGSAPVDTCSVFLNQPCDTLVVQNDGNLVCYSRVDGVINAFCDRCCPDTPVPGP